MIAYSRVLNAVILIVILCVVSMGLWGCEGAGTEFPNTPPQTRLANIPPDSITSSNPRLTLYWVGDDPDGFVVGFRYRWNFRLSASEPFQYKPWTTLLNISINQRALIMDGDESVAPKVYKYFSTLPPEGLSADLSNALDSGRVLIIEGVRVWASNPITDAAGNLVRYPTHVNPNSGTFIFDSQDQLNPHTFEIVAIDNNGKLDDTPASVYFNTPQVEPPHTEIISGPAGLDTVLVLMDPTDTFEGIRFTFQGFDQNSRVLEFQWVVDKDVWLATTGRIPWSEFSQSTEARVTASDFPDPYATQHTIYARARNEFGSIDTLGYFVRTTGDTAFARRTFNTVFPDFAKTPAPPKRILVLNNSFDFDTLAVLPAKPNYAVLDQYYTELYDAIGLAGQYDIWHVKTQGFPGRGALGRYSTVHFVGDIVNPDFYTWSRPGGTELQFAAGRQSVIRDYCYVGGNFIINGWNVVLGVNTQGNQEFFNNILHVQTPPFNIVPPEFVGTLGLTTGSPITQFPDTPLDFAKLDTSWHGGLPFFWGTLPYGFGEKISRFNSKSNIPFLETQILAIRYLGLTYNTFYLGFPLYYVEQPSAIEYLRKVHQNLGNIP